ncbi:MULTISPECIES: hypothetical protein [unclassified Rhizobium]
MSHIPPFAPNETLKFTRPGMPSVETMRRHFERLGVALPIFTHGTEAGEVIDSTGRDVFVVDLNGTRSDENARDIATLIAMAVNAFAGVSEVASNG